MSRRISGILWLVPSSWAIVNEHDFIIDFGKTICPVSNLNGEINGGTVVIAAVLVT